MCILFIAYRQRADFPLIIAANRDEFHQRATAPSQFWPENPDLLAGRDLKAGGTWMGVTRNGFISALTNIREPLRQNDKARSRGEVCAGYLHNPLPHHQQLSQLVSQRAEFNGYNFLFGHWSKPGVYNNRYNQYQSLAPGIHGLSNAQLNSPWPKVTKGMQALSQYCQQQRAIQCEDLFELLRNDELAEDEFLPDTGVGYEWEKALSAIFIRSPQYGTRSSTLLLINSTGLAYWQERTFNPNGGLSHCQEFEFPLAESQKRT
ncbi:NRDE family protein [Alteromonas aestuariivivens]|uniref:NRDE family protein n=1 Tax=Alteromonas aestuariivivens TaxID=1938339 RepID=A0A3D8MB72_9ALTE|nr:NRDE family protein [Alteromonas aestuariivivens]RDV27355.1 NRDE family protein [Alteromonas aestuariivivens]